MPCRCKKRNPNGQPGNCTKHVTFAPADSSTASFVKLEKALQKEAKEEKLTNVRSLLAEKTAICMFAS
jgi:hypothetical protein